MSFAGNAPTDPQSTGTRAGSAFSTALGNALGGALGGRRREAAAGMAGPARRGGRVAGAAAEAGPLSRRRGTPSSGSDTDWARVGAFGMGIALGALVGAGAALLYAPQSGTATRAVLRRQARRVGSRATDAWDELGNELRGVARRGRRKVRRGVTRGRWAAADFFEE